MQWLSLIFERSQGCSAAFEVCFEALAVLDHAALTMSTYFQGGESLNVWRLLILKMFQLSVLQSAQIFWGLFHG